jgi:phage-related protein
MSLLTFDPPVGPSPGTSHKPQLKILDADFGDGYTQPTPHGINHIRRTVALKWDALTHEQAEAIIAFFVRQGGTTPFYYRPFGDRVSRCWTCREWNHSADDGVWKVTAALMESFGASG